MKKLLLPAAILLLSVAAAAQTCTVTGAAIYNWPNNTNSVSCSEGGNATGKTLLIIPAGMTVIFDTNTDSWSGSRIEVYGTLRVTANPVVFASVTVKSGGILDLQGKLALGNGAGCNYKVI